LTIGGCLVCAKIFYEIGIRKNQYSVRIQINMDKGFPSGMESLFRTNQKIKLINSPFLVKKRGHWPLYSLTMIIDHDISITLAGFSLASSRLGMTRCRTPSLYVALIFSDSTLSGRANDLLKEV
jgi:hypothetical protein